MKRILGLLLAGLIAVSLFTCDELLTPEEEGNGTTDMTAAELVDSANTAMGDFMTQMMSNPPEDPGSAVEGDYTGLIVINGLFRQAVEKDPTNSMANFGAGLTELLMLVTDGSEFLQHVQQWETFIATHNIFGDSIEWDGAGKILPDENNLISTNPFSIEGASKLSATGYLKAVTSLPKYAQETPEISDLQNLIENTIMARVDYAIERLAVVEDDESFTFTITPEMQGNESASPRELDLTEIYMFDAVLHSIRALCNVVVSYNVNISPYDTTAFDRLESGGSFMTLRDGYESNMPAALDDIHSVLDKADAALDFLQGEGDSQSDDIIIIGESTEEQPGISNENIIIAHGLIDSVRTVFSGPVDIQLPQPEVQKTQVVSGDLDDGFLTVDISKLFDPAINDLKEFLPDYTIVAGSDTSYEYLEEEEVQGVAYDDSVEATIEIPEMGEYHFNFWADWNPWEGFYSGGEAESNIYIPEFQSAVWDSLEQLMTQIELPESQRLAWVNTYTWWGNYYNMDQTGVHDIKTVIYYSYGVEEATMIEYYPVPIWSANDYETWITEFSETPTQTLFGILPNFTQEDWVALFSEMGLNSETWSKNME